MALPVASFHYNTINCIVIALIGFFFSRFCCFFLCYFSRLFVGSFRSFFFHDFCRLFASGFERLLFHSFCRFIISGFGRFFFHYFNRFITRVFYLFRSKEFTGLFGNTRSRYSLFIVNIIFQLYRTYLLWTTCGTIMTFTAINSTNSLRIVLLRF